MATTNPLKEYWRNEQRKVTATPATDTSKLFKKPKQEEEKNNIASKYKTYIYDTKGNYIIDIYDAEKNEIVFIQENEKMRILASCITTPEAEQFNLSKTIRNSAFARLSLTTCRRLKEEYSKVYSKSSNEPGGILWINPESKELAVWGMSGENGNSFSFANTIDSEKYGITGGEFIGKNEIHGNPFAVWHGHPGAGFESSRPTDPQDYTENDKTAKTNYYFKDFFEHGAVGIIVTQETITIFPIWQGISKPIFEPKFNLNYKKSKSSNQWGVFNLSDLKFEIYWEK